MRFVALAAAAAVALVAGCGDGPEKKREPAGLELSAAFAERLPAAPLPAGAELPATQTRVVYGP